MFKTLLALTLLSTALSGFAATATCKGTYQGKALKFMAKGSVGNMAEGVGYVEIDKRVVATFDGEEAKVSYIWRTFNIENARGDYVEGKLNNIISGRSTLILLELPGEGLVIKNLPVNCKMDR